jgi:hypothetical protein
VGAFLGKGIWAIMHFARFKTASCFFHHSELGHEFQGVSAKAQKLATDASMRVSLSNQEENNSKNEIDTEKCGRTFC